MDSHHFIIAMSEKDLQIIFPFIFTSIQVQNLTRQRRNLHNIRLTNMYIMGSVQSWKIKDQIKIRNLYGKVS